MHLVKNSLAVIKLPVVLKSTSEPNAFIFSFSTISLTATD
jgi:hypothetical protein